MKSEREEPLLLSLLLINPQRPKTKIFDSNSRIILRVTARNYKRPGLI